MTINRPTFMAGIIGLTGAAVGAPPALAQGQGGGADTASAVVRVEAFGGVARDSSPLTGRDTDFSGGALPSLSFRAGDSVTVQLDGLIADHRDRTVAGVAGHFGFAPSDTLSLGLYGAYARFDGIAHLDNYRLGAEAVVRTANVRISGIAGYERTERASALVGAIPGFTVVDDYGHGGSFFDMVDVDVFPSDNLMISAGHRYVGRRHAAAVGFEAALTPGLSLFAEGRVGRDDYKAGWGGIRIRFGHGGASLKAVETNRLFANRLKDEMFASGNTRRRTLNVVTPPPPPPPPPGPECGCGASYCGA